MQQHQTSAADIFSEIYANNIWGGDAGQFFSGKGSNINFSQQYCELIKNFLLTIAANNITIVDLGCGDFRVGQNLLQTLEASQIQYQYIGVDIVPKLIEHNNTEYGDNRIKFECVDILEQELPQGDICLIRQVLQHLSNQDIKKVINKFSQYNYTFVTESLPEKETDCVPNVDISTGMDIRLKHDSGVFLNKPPFNIDNIELVLTIPYIEENPLYNRKSKLCTFKIEN